MLAVEPVEGMRQRFVAAVPGVPMVAAVAEALPIAPRSLDAVTVAQAFHWFDADRAFGEFARVLRRRGRVGLIWNARDRSSDWVNDVWSIMDRVEKRAPWRDHERGDDSAPRPRAGFGPLHAETFRHEQPITPEGVVDRIASVSHVAVLPPAERQRVLDEVRDVLTHHPDAQGRSELRFRTASMRTGASAHEPTVATHDASRSPAGVSPGGSPASPDAGRARRSADA